MADRPGLGWLVLDIFTNNDSNEAYGTVGQMAQYGKSAYWDERYTKYVASKFVCPCHALHPCGDECASFSNTAGSSEQLSFSNHPQQPP